ncbi:hypothetical protein BDV97DRAFT_363899 [Delphinella strobiligena]|nr:hypothetical protein BDV97DRAFT_363899 [Delphinella strobiligena]
MTIPRSLRMPRCSPFDIANIAELIALPSVNELATHRASENPHSEDSLAELQTKIVSMSHHDSELSAEVLTLLVQSSECLKSFEISPSAGAYTWLGLWRDTMTSISSQSDNIEDLTLHTYIYGWSWRGMDNLKRFHHLKHLRISEDALLNDDAWSYTTADVEDTDSTFAEGDIDFTFAKILPRSLETLTIFRASPNCVPALETLLASLRQAFPDLRAIMLLLNNITRSLLADDAPNMDVPSRSAALKREFEALSIEVFEETDYTYWLTFDTPPPRSEAEEDEPADDSTTSSIGSDQE